MGPQRGESVAAGRRRASAPRWVAAAAAALALGVLRPALPVATPAAAQAVPAAAPRAVPFDSLLARGLDLEAANRPREAAALFRQVVAASVVGPGGGPFATRPAGSPSDDSRTAALLGAERVYADLAQPDSVLPLVAPVLRARPADPVARTVQLRTLLTLGRRAEARAAFQAWHRLAPSDPAPFREFARLLLGAGERVAAHR